MDFNLKKYRVLKIKKDFKKSELIFFFNSAKIKSNKWIKTEKQLKKLKLEYYQIFNNTTLKTIKNSIYANINQLVSGVILLIKPIYKTTQLELKAINKFLDSLFLLLVVKLNNKIYTTTQLKNFNLLSYKKTVFNFYGNLERCLKTTNKLTLNKQSK
jgi:hypothetical protein